VTGLVGAGSVPIDAALSPDDDLLFVLSAGSGTLVSFSVKANGGLVNVGTMNEIPLSASGLVVN
jgi:hypothetical protein